MSLELEGGYDKTNSSMATLGAAIQNWLCLSSLHMIDIRFVALKENDLGGYRLKTVSIKDYFAQIPDTWDVSSKKAPIAGVMIIGAKHLPSIRARLCREAQMAANVLHFQSKQSTSPTTCLPSDLVRSIVECLPFGHRAILVTRSFLERQQQSKRQNDNALSMQM
jgi:hypothetical protein